MIEIEWEVPKLLNLFSAIWSIDLHDIHSLLQKQENKLFDKMINSTPDITQYHQEFITIKKLIPTIKESYLKKEKEAKEWAKEYRETNVGGLIAQLGTKSHMTGANTVNTGVTTLALTVERDD